MDIGLKLLLAKSKLEKTRTRIRLSREEIQDKRPSAIEYINGALDTEKDLLDVLEIIYELENELRYNGRELNHAVKINGLLKEQIVDLENEIKFKNLEL